MHDPIKATIVLDEDVDRGLVQASVPAEGQVGIAGVVEGLEDANHALQDTTTDLLAIACHGAPDAVLELVRRAASMRSGRPVVVLCESPPEYFVPALFEAGADDVIKLPETPERVMFSFEKALARHRRREVDSRGELAPMICVLGPKGGTGKTVAASNLVVELARQGKRSAVVDLDLQFGDVGLALGLPPERTLYDLATSGGALDAEKLDAYLSTHQSGARALLAPLRPDQASVVSNDLLREVYGVLRATHDFVVVDSPPDFTPAVIAAVDASSHVCMVGMLDTLSLKNTKLGLETLELMGYDGEAVSLVLNRAHSQVGLDHSDVEAIVGRRPDVLVPSDRDVPRSLNEGVPVVQGKSRSQVAGAFRELAALYVRASDVNGNGDVPAQNGRRRRGLRIWRAG
ncbi:MAG: AAA family ATPase [Actinomycetota bacterium]